MPTPPPDSICPRCGTVLAADAVRGLCPRCLARRAFASVEDDPLPAMPPSLASLRRFGDYELGEEIARGGMGVVYRARQLSLNREVAVKLLRDGALAGADDARRFRAEALAAGALRHRNIVGVYEIGEHEGQQFLAMPLILGRDLAALTREGPVPARQGAEWVRQVADAVQHAHDRGVLHRDLKPSNVLVEADGTPQVTDFGLACRLDAKSGLTLSGQVLGTPGYLSPEQASGRSRDVTAATDVYGLGALLYHLLTGRAPFVGESATAVLRQVEDREPIAPRLLNPTVPRDLDTIALKALAKAASSRYGTAREFGEDLSRWLEGQPIRARPISPAERAWRWAARNPIPASLTALIALLALAVVVISLVANVRLRQQRAQAEQVKNFITELLASPDPTKDGREVRVADVLARASQRAAAELTRQPLVLAEVQSTLGVTYYQLSLYAEAEPLLRSALALYSRALGADSVEAAEARANLGSLLVWDSRQAAGAAELTEAVRILRSHQPEAKRELASALSELGTALQVGGRYDDAAERLREAITLCREIGAAADPTLASSLGELSTVCGAQGRSAESLRLNAEAIAVNRRLPDGQVNLATCLSNQADWHARLDQFDLALQTAREALALRESLFGTNSSPVAFSHARLAQVLLAATNYPAALEQSARAVSMARAVLPARHLDLQFHLLQYGQALLRLGRTAEAVEALREAGAIALENFGAAHRRTQTTLCALAEALAAQGAAAEALALLEANIGVVETQAQAELSLASALRRKQQYTDLLARLRAKTGAR